MAEETLEQIAKTAPEDKKQEKGPTSGEVVAKELSDLAKVLLAAGAVGVSYLLGGSDAAVITASFPLGRIIVNALAGKPTTAANIRDEGGAGLAFTPAVLAVDELALNAPKYLGLEGVVANILGHSGPLAPLAVAGLNFAVVTPALLAAFYPILYLFQNKKFEGMGKYFKENYLRSLAWTLPVNIFASAILGAAYSGVPFIAPYLFPLLALANIGFYIFASPDISYLKKLLSPVLVPYYLAKGAVKGAYTIANLVYKGIEGIFTGAKDIGSAIGGASFGGPAHAPAR